MPFAPAFGAVGRIRASQRPTTHRAHGTTVHDGARPIDVTVAREPVQEREVHQIPDTFLMPIAQASPTGHPRSAAQLLRQHLPRNPAAQDEEDAGKTGAIRDARSSTVRSRRPNGQKRFDEILQCVRQQNGGHDPLTLLRPNEDVYRAIIGFVTRSWRTHV